MSVIGRLDEQVDAVLIKPLERGGEPARDGDGAASSNENIERPQSAIQTALEKQSTGSAHDERAELPVWLL
jgi:hypothetical protein